MVEASAEKLAELQRLTAEVAELNRRIAAKAPARPRPWHGLARTEQLPPPGDWDIWLYLAGRGSGKTRSGAEWIIEQAARTPDSEWAVIAPTWRDCQKVCFEGSSGLVRSLLPGEFESMNMSALQLRLSNGSRIYGYSADRPDRLRGANLHGAWIDEIAAMVRSEDLMGEALMPALRIGEHPRVMITTTPRPVKVIKELVARTDGSVVVVRGTTWDNAANLSKTALAALRARYEGTRMGRQELEAEILEDVEGALWTRDRLDASRVDAAPHMARIVVGVDPAVTSGEKSDFTGIVVAGKSADGDLYILEDLTMKGSPHACMVAAVNAYKKWEADRIVGEVNNGGDYLEGLLRTVDPNVSYKSVRATRGKTVRAEPIASLWEQGRGHIVGVMPALEDEMCSFSLDGSTGDHDDRVDACFVAGTPVLTARGEVPIEQVVAGDMAWTRAGWKPVLRSERTRRAAEVMTVELSNGQILTGTPNHRIWTSSGWTDLDSLVWGDILEGWMTTPYPSNSMASDTPATPTLNSAATRPTTWRPAGGTGSTCTAKSGGAPILARRFPRAGTSTTSITTRSTMTLPTWKPSTPQSTAPGMPGNAATRSGRTSIGSGQWPQRGTEAPRESRGTARTASVRGTAGSTPPGTVIAADPSTGRLSGTDPGTALGLAATVSTTSRTGTRSACPAPPAVPSSGSPSTGPSPQRAAVSVRGLFVEPERHDVYDLMVADQHEFVAAGVIVHNCTWAATELAVGASAMTYLSAISRVCDRCDMPNRRTDAACRGCGEQLPAVA